MSRPDWNYLEESSSLLKVSSHPFGFGSYVNNFYAGENFVPIRDSSGNDEIAGCGATCWTLACNGKARPNINWFRFNFVVGHVIPADIFRTVAVDRDKVCSGYIASADCRGSKNKSCKPGFSIWCKDGHADAVNHEHALPPHVDHALNIISKEPIGKGASLPLARSYVEREAVGRVGFARPPSTAGSQLFRLGGGDERSKAVTFLGKRRQGALLEAKGLD